MPINPEDIFIWPIPTPNERLIEDLDRLGPNPYPGERLGIDDLEPPLEQETPDEQVEPDAL